VKFLSGVVPGTVSGVCICVEEIESFSGDGQRTTVTMRSGEHREFNISFEAFMKRLDQVLESP
jgi:hypothetical protein